MTIDKNAGAYTVAITNGEYETSAMLDTGAFATILGFDSACGLLQCEASRLENVLTPYLAVPIITVYGERAKAAPCAFSNVSVGGRSIHNLFALISPKVSWTLLGFDFVDACSLAKEVGRPVYVHDIAEDVYKQNFLDAVGDRHVDVRLLLKGIVDNLTSESTSAEQLWFVGLSDEERQQLADYSPVLYAQLTRGTFTEDLRILLDGFKNLYNL